MMIIYRLLHRHSTTDTHAALSINYRPPVHMSLTVLRCVLYSVSNRTVLLYYTHSSIININYLFYSCATVIIADERLSSTVNRCCRNIQMKAQWNAGGVGGAG